MFSSNEYNSRSILIYQKDYINLSNFTNKFLLLSKVYEGEMPIF